MYEIKAHEVIYKGAHFRSKNECKRYIFLKELGWNVEYEPILDDVKGWIPDLFVIGDGTKVLVEIKPYQTLTDFDSEYALNFEKKIHNSGWYNNYDSVLIFGSTLNLGGDNSGGDTFVGGRCFRTGDYSKEEWKKYKENPDWHSKMYLPGPFLEDNFVYTTFGVSDEDIDVCDEVHSFIGHIWGSYEGGYGLHKKGKEKIETAWNHAGTEMRYVKRVT
tara:strand:- start:1 stop:654 length:654 start_codon:yes stop_codon:yes gene_type:complete